VVLLPLSPIEEHGPHLPIGTDIIAAEDIAKEAAQHLLQENSALHVVVSPTIPLGCAPITADFPGTISLKGTTLFHLLVDYCSGLAQSGFKFIVIVNHHLDSVHLKAILEAIDEVMANFNIKITETAGHIFYSGIPVEEVAFGRELGLEMKCEVHADVRETSYIKYRYPELLKQDPTDLKPLLRNVGQELRKGYTTFKEMGAKQGYIGSPALASEEYGKIHLEEQARLTAEIAINLAEGKAALEINPVIMHYLKTKVHL